MNITTSPIALSFAAIACASSAAHSAYVGTHTALHTTVDADGMKDVYRVYALFDNTGDNLTTVFGNLASPMTVSLNGATAYNPAGNIPLPMDAITDPDQIWDSYATIGVTSGYEGNIDIILTPLFPTFVTSNGINSSNVGWLELQGHGLAASGIPVGLNWGVLTMQITVNAGDPSPSGQFGLIYTPAGGQTTSIFNQTFGIPAPSTIALAIFSFAAITKRRRRR